MAAKTKAPAPMILAASNFVGNRCSTCNWKELNSFIDGTLELTHKEGHPRPTVKLMHNAILLAFSDSKRKVPAYTSLFRHLADNHSKAWGLWDDE